MQTDLPSHPQAFLKLHTGNSQFVRPSLGAWTLYGLGTLNENLPGFITLTPPSGFGGAQNYGSAFLPAIYQATRIGSDNRPIASAEVRNLETQLSPNAQRAELDLIQTLNREKLARDRFNPEVEGVIESYELAFKMQSQMPQVHGYLQGDRGDEKALRNRRYRDRRLRAQVPARAALCRSRRALRGNHPRQLGPALQSLDRAREQLSRCRSVQSPACSPICATRGLLKDTLVVWAGEFGRTPHAQGGDGRDHNNKAFTIWMAGGGVKGGLAYGQTDDYGYEAVENKVQIHDLHATMLALLGLDHEKLTYRYAGRDFRLTDVAGNVVKEIIA